MAEYHSSTVGVFPIDGAWALIPFSSLRSRKGSFFFLPIVFAFLLVVPWDWCRSPRARHQRGRITPGFLVVPQGVSSVSHPGCRSCEPLLRSCRYRLFGNFFFFLSRRWDRTVGPPYGFRSKTPLEKICVSLQLFLPAFSKCFCEMFADFYDLFCPSFL